MSDTPDFIDSFVRMREALLREADTVPPDLRLTPFVGHWNLMDVLAHLVGWDYTNVNAIEELKSGATPAFYSDYDPGWTSYNRQLIDRYGADDWQTLRAAIDQSQAAVVQMLRLLTPEELAQELSDPGRPRRPASIAAILRAAIRDEREHLQQIRALVGSQRMGSG
jgi:hypothetical protein